MIHQNCEMPRGSLHIQVVHSNQTNHQHINLHIEYYPVIVINIQHLKYIQTTHSIFHMGSKLVLINQMSHNESLHQNDLLIEHNDSLQQNGSFFLQQKLSKLQAETPVLLPPATHAIPPPGYAFVEDSSGD